jgi:hypothetical protein
VTANSIQHTDDGVISNPVTGLAPKCICTPWQDTMCLQRSAQFLWGLSMHRHWARRFAVLLGAALTLLFGLRDMLAQLLLLLLLRLVYAHLPGERPTIEACWARLWYLLV